MLLAAIEADVRLAELALLGMRIAEVVKALGAAARSRVRTILIRTFHGNDATRFARSESTETFAS